MLRKQEMGAAWFISQAVYDADASVQMLQDYGELCRTRGIQPAKVCQRNPPTSAAISFAQAWARQSSLARRSALARNSQAPCWRVGCAQVVLSFAPVGRPKTMDFVKWLGIQVPAEVESRIAAKAEISKQAPPCRRFRSCAAHRARAPSAPLVPWPCPPRDGGRGAGGRGRVDRGLLRGARLDSRAVGRTTPRPHLACPPPLLLAPTSLAPPRRTPGLPLPSRCPPFAFPLLPPHGGCGGSPRARRGCRAPV